MSTPRPLLLYDANDGIFATPAAYNLSSTKTAIQVRAAVFKRPAFSTPRNCMAQCTFGSPHLCLVPRYDLQVLVPVNQGKPLLGATCDIIDKPYSGDPAKYRFKYGNEFYGPLGWVPQAKVIAPTPPAVNVTAPECFAACDLDPSCWVATSFLRNATCLHFPMASSEDKVMAEAQVWWLWEARKGFKLEESGLVGVQNLTQVVAKAHLEKGVDDEPSSGRRVSACVGSLRVLMSLVVIAVILVRLPL
ncbi:hypothetical protein BCR44DRAFT_1429485 [Catenaria anguillulae PL171]|uniref:Apple domain-containing protein n=1 Tax=Catenaria anguillulae PL171 TaxID=765915 RepID=A0A1Y2HTY2_9FUNG|nr:hypothetical protein BCR44DRAFT_1429485 [Catenaria anguillulae PL171]